MLKSKVLIFLSFFVFSKTLFSQQRGIDEAINEAFLPISNFWETNIFDPYIVNAMISKLIGRTIFITAII